MKRPLKQADAGFSIMEAAFAAGIIAIALSSMFAFNSACLLLVRNAKESAAAMLSNQQRVEELRSWNWKFLTDNDYWADPANPKTTTSFWLASLMNVPTESGAALNNATEVVTVTENGFLQGATAASFQVTRNSSGASLTDSNNPVSLYTAKMLKIDVTLSWKALGGRNRSRKSSAIIAYGGLIYNVNSISAPNYNW
jgi:Tfp pilus assembly protein PilV